MKWCLHGVFLFSFLSSAVLAQKTVLNEEEVTITIQKYCSSIYEIVDRGDTPPVPKKVFNYQCFFISPLSSSDTTAIFKNTINATTIDCEITAGLVRIDKNPHYYIGHDQAKLSEWEWGIKKFNLKINGRQVTLTYDHILHPNIREMKLMVDKSAKKVFVLLTSSEGGGSSQTFWVIENQKVTGLYNWEYGYDEWLPRNGVDAFKTQANDSCQTYKIEFE